MPDLSPALSLLQAVWDSTRRRWLGDGEASYRLAITHRNASAVVAIEYWKGRQPFCWQGQRLFVGRTLTWQGQRVSVTSFNDPAGCVVLCASVPQPRSQPCATGDQPHVPEGRRVVQRRYRLTPADLAAVYGEEAP
jgi:hypothetical protein